MAICCSGALDVVLAGAFCLAKSLSRVSTPPDTTLARTIGTITLSKVTTRRFQCRVAENSQLNRRQKRFSKESTRVSRLKIGKSYNLGLKKLQKNYKCHNPLIFEFYCIFINKYFSIFPKMSKSFWKKNERANTSNFKHPKRQMRNERVKGSIRL